MNSSSMPGFAAGQAPPVDTAPTNLTAPEEDSRFSRTDRVVGAVLVLAALLLMLASALTHFTLHYPADAEWLRRSGWSLSTPLSTVAAQQDTAQYSGIPMMAAALLALIVGILLLIRPHPIRGLGLLAGGLMSGVSVTVLFEIVSDRGLFGQLGETLGLGPLTDNFSFGAGFWLIVVATALSLVTVLLSLAGERANPRRGAAR